MRHPRPDIGYIPTPQRIVDMMLSLAAVQPDDVVYDLGCGDGRVLITAAQRFGVKGVGLDVDPDRIAACQELAQAAGVSDRLHFQQANLFTTDVHAATVVTLYLLPHLNLRLRSRLWQQLRPGSRIVSHQFDMADWRPDQVIDMRQTEEESTLYRWTITGQEQLTGALN